jgi:hypothetical protein
MFKKKQKKKKLGTPIIDSLTKLEVFIEDNFRQFTPVLNNFFFGRKQQIRAMHRVQYQCYGLSLKSSSFVKERVSEYGIHKVKKHLQSPPFFFAKLKDFTQE